MLFEQSDNLPASAWPVNYDLEELHEMAAVLRGHEIYAQLRDRLAESGQAVGRLSSRQLCWLVLEDMHTRAGLPVLPEHF